MRRQSHPEDKVPIDTPFDFENNANWRIFRIMGEFIDGFEFLAPLRKEVTIFGSARLPEDSHWYKEAQRLEDFWERLVLR